MNEIIKNKDFSIIKIYSKYGNFDVMIDTEDINKINNITWHFHYKRNSSNFYFAGYNRATKKQAFLHRLIMNAKDGDVIDHIDRNTLNNRKQNLRFCSYSENNKNRPREAYGNRLGKSNIKYLCIHKNKSGTISYTVKFPNLKVKTFKSINEAKAYYLECLLNYGGKI